MGLAVWLRNLAWLSREDLMATVEQFTSAITAINDATNQVAEEVAALKAIISEAGLTPAQEATVLEQLSSIETKLRAIAAPETPPV